MRLAEMSDEDLVLQAQGGRREAFGELARRHLDNTSRLCLKMLGAPEDAEDHAQESLVRAYQALGSFRGSARFSTWLYRIAVNVCLGTLRRKRLRTVSLDRPVELGDTTVVRDVADSTPDPGERLLADELRSLVGREVENLSPKNRTVFDLRVNQSLSTEDTAALLGVSTSCVKSRLHRARGQLRDSLYQYISCG